MQSEKATEAHITAFLSLLLLLLLLLLLSPPQLLLMNAMLLFLYLLCTREPCAKACVSYVVQVLDVYEQRTRGFASLCVFRQLAKPVTEAWA